MQLRPPPRRDPAPGLPPVATRRGRLIFAAARLSLWVERLLPALLPALLLGGLFLAVAFADVLPALPGWLHLAVLMAGLGGLVLLAWRGLRGFRRPDDASVRRRVEADSGLMHRPLDALDDDLATDPADPTAAALWQVHRERLAGTLGRLRLGPPRPRTAFHDPRALRVPVLLLLAAALWEAGPNAVQRLQRALTPEFTAGSRVPLGLQVWITPPAYTGEAPVFLELGKQVDKPVPVPAGSTLLAVLQGGRGDARLTIGGQETAFARLDETGQRLETVLDDGDRLVIRQGTGTVADWPIAVVADRPPQVAFDGLPESDRDNRLRLAITALDDYGLVKGWAEMRRVGAPTDGDPGVVPLPLPTGRKKEVSAAASVDLTGHVWAGLPVTLTPVVQDAKGQVGRGEPVDIVLPEREFRHPIARALADIRRRLAVDPDYRLEGAATLDGLASRPDRFGGDMVAFLTMRVARFRLVRDGRVEAIPQVMDMLWQTAVRIEDGGLPEAERFLADTMRQLQEALDSGASPEEIERLMDQLQAAMQQMMQALAEQAARQGLPPMPMDPQAQTVTDEDLQRMIERMRDLAQTGSRDAAQQMLSQLQQMMQNLQMGQSGGDSGESKAMQEALQELQKLPPRQQDLMDRTFRASPEGQRRQSPSFPSAIERALEEMRRQQPGQSGQGQPRPVPQPQTAQDQEGLRRQLGEAMRRLGETGLPIPDALGQAEQAMREAGRSLRQGDAEGALQAQGEALDSLRQGMREALQSMAQQMGPGRVGQGAPRGPGRDPLGRPLGGQEAGDDPAVKIPNQSDTQRARQILDELRRRSGEADRTETERGYLRRLLDLF